MHLSKRTLLRLGAAGLAAGGLAACTSLGVDPAAETTAKTAYKLFCSGEDAKLEAMFVAAARTPTFHAEIERIRTLVPKGAPPQPKTTGWRVFAGTSGPSTTLVHEYDYPDTVATVTTVLVPAGVNGGWLLQSFNVNISVPPLSSGGSSKQTSASSTP